MNSRILPEVPSKDDEGEEGSAKQGVGGDFAENVTGEDAHFLCCLVNPIQVYPGVEDCQARCWGMIFARQLGDGLRSPSLGNVSWMKVTPLVAICGE